MSAVLRAKPSTGPCWPRSSVRGWRSSNLRLGILLRRAPVRGSLGFLRWSRRAWWAGAAGEPGYLSHWTVVTTSWGAATTSWAPVLLPNGELSRDGGRRRAGIEGLATDGAAGAPGDVVA